MTLSKKMQDALNEQINAEFYSGYLYLSMSSYCETQNLPGFAHWMRMQALEEQMHAMKLHLHVVERDGVVQLGAIKKPPANWKNPADVFAETLKHEKKVTQLIHELVNLAKKEKDAASEIFLQWYVTEQVEEEASAKEVLDKLKLVSGDKMGLLMIDQGLSARLPGAIVAEIGALI